MGWILGSLGGGGWGGVEGRLAQEVSDARYAVVERLVVKFWGV